MIFNSKCKLTSVHCGSSSSLKRLSMAVWPLASKTGLWHMERHLSGVSELVCEVGRYLWLIFMHLLLMYTVISVLVVSLSSIMCLLFILSCCFIWMLVHFKYCFNLFSVNQTSGSVYQFIVFGWRGESFYYLVLKKS